MERRVTLVDNNVLRQLTKASIPSRQVVPLKLNKQDSKEVKERLFDKNSPYLCLKRLNRTLTEDSGSVVRSRKYLSLRELSFTRRVQRFVLILAPADLSQYLQKAPVGIVYSEKSNSGGYHYIYLAVISNAKVSSRGPANNLFTTTINRHFDQLA